MYKIKNNKHRFELSFWTLTVLHYVFQFKCISPIQIIEPNLILRHALRELIRNKFAELAPSKSFAKNWMEKFGETIKSVTNC